MGLRKNDLKSQAETQEVKKEYNDGVLYLAGNTAETEVVTYSLNKEEVVEEEVPEKEPEIVKTDSEIELEKAVNEKREEYKAYALKQKRLNIIITSIVAVVLIAAFFGMMMLSDKYEWVLYLCLGAMILVLGSTYFLSKVMRKRLLAQSEVYIDFLCKEVSKYVYSDKKVKDLVVTPKGSLEYKDLVGTKGRNFAHFEYNGMEVDSCDLAANYKVKNRLAPKFLGRYYSFKPNFKTDGKVTIFQLKGGELSVPIDDIDDLNFIEGNKQYCIYSNDPNAKKVLNDRVIKALLKFKVKNPLIDVIFSVKDNLVSLGIDYTDEFINIPVDKDFSIKNSKIAKEDFAKVMNVVKVLLESNKEKEVEEKSK